MLVYVPVLVCDRGEDVTMVGCDDEGECSQLCV